MNRPFLVERLRQPGKLRPKRNHASVMDGLAIEYLDQGLHQAVFEAMPMALFVVDGDVNVLEYNAAAGRLAGEAKRSTLRRRGGEVLHCIHATESPEGCGHSAACRDCVIRNSVQAAARGEPVTRQWAPVELSVNGTILRANLEVSCLPFNFGRQAFILLMLDGLGS